MICGKLSAEKYSELVSNAARPQGEKSMSATVTPGKCSLRAATSESRPAVNGTQRSASLADTRKREQRFSTRSAASATETPSQRDYARNGVLFKHLASKAGLGVSLTEHESGILDELCNEEWSGNINGEYRSLSGTKALLDSVTSGGIEITPTAFDDSIITFPLLQGELFPQVDLKPIPRGRRVEGALIGNPTLSWGQGDAVDVGLFDTAALVAAIDTTIYGVAVAIEIGRDFLSDAAVDVGKVLTEVVGSRLANELDKVIANGNGTTNRKEFSSRPVLDRHRPRVATRDRLRWRTTLA